MWPIWKKAVTLCKIWIRQNVIICSNFLTNAWLKTTAGKKCSVFYLVNLIHFSKYMLSLNLIPGTCFMGQAQAPPGVLGPMKKYHNGPNHHSCNDLGQQVNFNHLQTKPTFIEKNWASPFLFSLLSFLLGSMTPPLGAHCETPTC